MDKTVLLAVTYVKQKYYFNPEFKDIPVEVVNELRIISVNLAEKIHATFIIGFFENGDVYFEIVDEGDFDFDEIGAELEIKKLKTEKQKLIQALKLWYVIYKTENGEKIKDELLL